MALVAQPKHKQRKHRGMDGEQVLSVDELRTLVSQSWKSKRTAVEEIRAQREKPESFLRELRRQIGRAWHGRGAVAEVRAQRDGGR